MYHLLFIKYCFLVILSLLCLEMIVTRSDTEGIIKDKSFLRYHSKRKDTGKTQYFLGMEVAMSK